MATQTAFSILGHINDSDFKAKLAAQEQRYREAVKRDPRLSSDAKYRASTPKLIQQKPDTGAAIDAANAAQDIDALRWAIWQHLGTNHDLAEIVSDEILRKLPWYPVPNPLTPITKSKVSHVVNYLAKKRYQDLRRETWARQYDVHLEDYQREPLLYDKVGENDLIDGQEEIAEFIGTLSTEEQEVLQECLSKRRERKGFRALLQKAEDWSKPAEAPGEPTTCACNSCSQRPWTALEALRSVDEVGTLPATIGLLKGLPARRPRPVGWQLEAIRTPVFTDQWKSKGRSHTNPVGDGDYERPDQGCHVPMGPSAYDLQ